MRMPRPRAPLLLVFGVALAPAAARAKTPAPARAPVPIAAGAAAQADDVPIAADASPYYSLRLPSDGSAPPPEAAGPTVGLLRQLGGVDLLDATTATRLTLDRQRPLIASSTIVEPARLRAALASPDVPPDDAPFTFRYLIVVPVEDPARADGALDTVMPGGTCARPRRDPPRWAAWLKGLQHPGDRRAAEASDAAYVCVAPAGAIVVRVNRSRRELRWIFASGQDSTLAAASEPVRPDRALDELLRREGFYAASSGLYTTPSGEARGMIARGLIKSLAGLGGLPKEKRAAIWQLGAKQVSAAQRLVESPPVLISAMLMVDGVCAWTLTDEGKKYFSSLNLQPRTPTKAFKQTVAKTLKLSGMFAVPDTFGQNLREAGSMASALVQHALWPQAIAFTAAYPQARSMLQTLFDEPAGERGDVEVDVQAGRVRLRPKKGWFD